MIKTPEDVQNELNRLGVDTTVQSFDQSTRTAQEAADAIGCALGAIVKSLCFTVNGTPILVLTAGDQKVDNRKIAEHYQVGRKKVKIADEETTGRVTGFAPGGVAPLAHNEPLPIFIDETLSRFATVYAAAGTANTIFPVPFEKLVEITEGTLMDVIKPEGS